MVYLIRAINISGRGGSFTAEARTKRVALITAKTLRNQGMLVTVTGPDGKPYLLGRHARVAGAHEFGKGLDREAVRVDHQRLDTPARAGFGEQFERAVLFGGERHSLLLLIPQVQSESTGWSRSYAAISSRRCCCAA